MIGAIAGDIIGSVYEFDPIKTEEFPLFDKRSYYTDDTVLTIAVADAILNKREYGEAILAYARAYPRKGYGSMFSRWINSDHQEPYNSFGNGSAMRVSPVGFAFNDLDALMNEAKKSAEVTHNHPEGIKGAQAVAAAIYLARSGESKEDIKNKIKTMFSYNLDLRLDDIRPTYAFDETCQRSVPQAIVAFLESKNYEDAIRKAISLGGDSDTIACIAGGIAQAYYKKIPDAVTRRVEEMLDPELIAIVHKFNEKYGL